MAQSISNGARELYAQHCREVASLTPAQLVALDREALAKSQGSFNHKPWRENLIELFERLAKEAGSA